MKTIVGAVMVVLVVLFAPMVGAKVEAGGLFDAGSGERILDAAIAGVVVGAAVGVLGEVLGGGRDHRDVVIVPGGHGGWHGGYGRGGCRSCGFEYQRQYNAGLASGENARRYRSMQRDEEFRLREAIRAERTGSRGYLDGFEDGSRPRRRRH